MSLYLDERLLAASTKDRSFAVDLLGRDENYCLTQEEVVFCVGAICDAQQARGYLTKEYGDKPGQVEAFDNADIPVSLALNPGLETKLSKGINAIDKHIGAVYPPKLTDEDRVILETAKDVLTVYATICEAGKVIQSNRAVEILYEQERQRRAYGE